MREVCEWLAAVLPGRSLADDLPDEPHDWAQRCAVPPEQLGRLLIVEDALLAARAAALANAGQTPVKPGAFR